MTYAFEYEAHDVEGHAHVGRLDADGPSAAQSRLEQMGLDVAVIRHVPEVRPAKPLAAEDVLAFNEQLLHLTRAGLPLEEGLRLIAADMRPGKARAITKLAEKLEAGATPEEAVASLNGALPPLYGRLLQAGVATGDLPGVLLGLGRHLALKRRLRAAAVRSLAYPVVLLLAVIGVGLLISLWVLPGISAVFEDFGVMLPAITRWILAVGPFVPPVLLGVLVLLVAWPTIWATLRLAGRGQWWIEQTLMRLPLIGPVLKFGIIARWLNAVAVAVRGGLDLPAALRLANDTVRSPRLSHDSEAMVHRLEQGGKLAGPARLRLLPTAVPASIDLASTSGDLATTLDTLSDLYQRRAEMSVSRVPLVLMPLALAAIALIVTVLLLAMLMPMVTLIQTVSG